MTTIPTITLHDGTAMPQLGFGVFQVPDDGAQASVATALEAGYRSIDTAAIYGNEAGVGHAIAESGLDHGDVFVTTKLWLDGLSREGVRPALEASLERLGLERVDLYLIHWPAPSKGLALETWKALVELEEQRRIRSIGVSNFRVEDLRLIEAETGVLPVLNQIEVHPYLGNGELRAFHAEKGIVTESWSPLGQGGGELEDPVVTQVAEAHGASPAQVLLAWNLALGNVVISKSVTPERIAANLASLELTLTEDEIAQISADRKSVV